jgi:hypothetical protein
MRATSGPGWDHELAGFTFANARLAQRLHTLIRQMGGALIGKVCAARGLRWAPDLGPGV